MKDKSPLPWEVSFNSGLIIDANHDMVDLDDDDIKQMIVEAVNAKAGKQEASHET